ncbi:MAG: hypothetical protein IJ334_14450, partial [Clostridia bacterium]|nr:hypothetical protein [Clostridia bacterium]
DEFIKKYGADGFRKLIEESRGKFEFKLDEIYAKYNLENAPEKIKAAGEICSFIAGIHSSVERDIYIEKTASRFGLERTSVKNDVEAKRRRNAYEQEKKRRGELIRITSGIGDRVNPDFAKQPRASRLEEDILGMILLRPEYLTRPTDGKILETDELPTDLGKRLHAFIREQNDNGGFSVSMLNENFTMDEVSRVSRMMAERSELNVNDEISYDTYIRALREENTKNGPDKALSLENLLAKKRSGLKNQ